MPLLNDHLSLWEVGFRWVGYDPDKPRIGIPLPVRDVFRILIHEIYHMRLDCFSMDANKYYGDDPEEAKFYIRYWLDPIERCTYGKRFDKELLKWAIIERQALQEWCERHRVPLPEFWFPPGWGIEYEWPDDYSKDDAQQQVNELATDYKGRIDKRHRIKMACQQISLALWAKEPLRNKRDIAGSFEVRTLGGGSEYELETIEEWLAEVDPRDPSMKRGRRRKNNSGSENKD